MVREETVYLLSEFEDERVVEHLTRILLKDKDEAVRASAAEELGDLGDQRAIDSLIQALGDDNARVRESAAMALGEIGDKRAIPRLMKLLEDKNEDVRDSAAEALGEITERHGISERE
jgi:HEAT repeat protein